jgi:hypothetical protein
MHRSRAFAWLFASALLLPAPLHAALESCGAPDDRVFDNGFGSGPTLSAGDETTLMQSPPGSVAILPDEHSSFLPPAGAGDPYLFFEAARVGSTGAIVLATTDLQTFSLAAGYTSPVLKSPKAFTECATAADPAGLDDEFDENYAAPGSVLRDPTLPAGNLIMVYEGENHCRGGSNVQPYYATAGLARSSDDGVTWPAPSIAPAAQRYPILGGPDPKPSDPSNPTAIGDAIPSAYIKGRCLYVVYAYHPAPDNPDTHAVAIQIARAQLDGTTTNPLTFDKYLRGGGAGGFTSDGLTGAGTDVIPFTPIGGVSATPVCTGTQYQPGLSYNETLHRYLMTFVCEVSSTAGQLGWFFSTATSLDAEDWSPPQLIANTQSTATTPCNGSLIGTSFDGWYPSLYSLNLAMGRTGTDNVAFYLDGCNLDTDRMFKSRPVTVTPDPG